MVFFLLALGATVFFAVLLGFMLLTSPPTVSERLAQVAAPGPSLDVVPARAVGPTSPLAGPWAKIFSLHKYLGIRPDADLARRLSMAGYRQPQHAEIFASTKLVLPLVTAAILSATVRENMLFWIILGAVLAFFLPDLWLTRAAEKRRELLRFGLPDALDLLIICMEAGLGLDQALFRVGNEMRISHPVLGAEFLQVNLEQRAGKPRLEAWRNMADRTGVDNLRSFVQMLVQTERFGTPISKSLTVFCDTLRIRRRQQAEEAGAKTNVKLIPPLVLFIFPSLFIVLLAPAVITVMKNLSKVFGG